MSKGFALDLALDLPILEIELSDLLVECLEFLEEPLSIFMVL